ncbi:MAG: hypothetical protein KAJ49_08205 [Arcobacteraceae bacterium]|nr:hypothetical protein [Arcobacteraceae bacterium]
MLVYFFVLGSFKTVNLIIDEYILISIVVFLSFVPLYLKKKLVGIDLIDFDSNSQISIKHTILFFLLFQVIDFYYEDGFIGMISQWFLYWIMGILTVIVMSIINYYKNYKYFLNNIK